MTFCHPKHSKDYRHDAFNRNTLYKPSRYIPIYYNVLVKNILFFYQTSYFIIIIFLYTHSRNIQNNNSYLTSYNATNDTKIN